MHYFDFLEFLGFKLELFPFSRFILLFLKRKNWKAPQDWPTSQVGDLARLDQPSRSVRPDPILPPFSPLNPNHNLPLRCGDPVSLMPSPPCSGRVSHRIELRSMRLLMLPLSIRADLRVLPRWAHANLI
jgi:hypothetical protein